jgi:hypothetical protein
LVQLRVGPVVFATALWLAACASPASHVDTTPSTAAAAPSSGGANVVFLGDASSELVRGLASRGVGVTTIPIGSPNDTAVRIRALERPTVLVGQGAGAAVAAKLALDPEAGLVGAAKPIGVVGLGGTYDVVRARGNAPPFLLVSTHDVTPSSAQSTRAFARALERAGAASVRSYHLADSDPGTLGARKDLADRILALIRGEPPPPPESVWAVADTWGATAPLSSEAFFVDPSLVKRGPVDESLRAQVRRVFGSVMNELEPWPSATYDAIDLDAYLRAHPETGQGNWLEVTNARGEKLVLSRDEIRRRKLEIVIGIDDERNLFRMYVTYNVFRTYSWKPETEPRPLLVRNLGAFLHQPGEEPPSSGGWPVVTYSDFALTPESFRVVAQDPWSDARGRGARADARTDKLRATLAGEQGCLQCHAVRGVGGRAHHLRAADGKVAPAFALALEEYPAGVLERFLYDQETVAKGFGVGPLKVDAESAKILLQSLR